jgi:Ca-activated chloride channel family protein
MAEREPFRSGVRECAAVLGVIVSLAAEVSGRQPTSFHAETRLVVLHVLVTNSRGEVVTDLDRGAFSVYEDGRRQSIALFRRDDVPISLGLIIDNSGSMRALRASVEGAALAFVHASNPNDEVFVVNFADTPRIDVPFTNDIRMLETGIARVDSIGGTALRDAILCAERYVHDHASRDRHALLVITDGNDNASTVTTAQARRVVERSGSVLYAIRLVREGLSADDRHSGELDHLVELTGGSVRHPASMPEVDRAMLEIAHQMRNEYTIAYTPANQALDGSYRVVRVKITGPRGLSARTRPGYWATARGDQLVHDGGRE